MSRHLIVLVKWPRAGAVKTRLTKGRGKYVLLPAAAAKLYEAFVRDTLDLARKVKAERRVIVFSPRNRRRELQKWMGSRAAAFDFLPQSGKNLGARLAAAFKFCAKNGAKRIVAIGSDSPHLPEKYVRDAFRALEGAPVALGPANDGGYYAIGLRATALKSLLPVVFRKISWSTSRVFRQTVARARAAGVKFFVLPRWEDVDSPESLRKLCVRGAKLPPHTRTALRDLGYLPRSASRRSR
jgi:rSAM/selenodomain-associated transferase 1